MKASLLTVTITNHSRMRGPSPFIICALYAQPHILVGCWTQMSIAYDVEMDKCIFLKDSWRINLDNIPREGETYAKLHNHWVPYIAECSLAEDVGEECFHHTRTHDVNGKCETFQPLPCFVAHRHY